VGEEGGKERGGKGSEGEVCVMGLVRDGRPCIILETAILTPWVGWSGFGLVGVWGLF